MAVSTEIKQFDLLINGRISPSKEGRYFDSLNPSTGEVLARVADASAADMEAAIAAARNAFDDGRWSGLTIRERGQYLHRIAQAIREKAKILAELESLDTGKTSKQSTFIDVPTCADTFEHFAGINAELKGSVNPVPAPVKSLTEREPIGVVGCIIPWNYPLIMAAWKIAPALMAGNTIVLKPSPLASVSILKLAEIIRDIGLPDGVLNIVTGQAPELGEQLTSSPLVDMISFSGSSQTGQAVMKQAAATTKKLVLELGGKSPNIVFADCDFEAALGGTMSAIFMNQGQMCTAGSRLLLDEKIYDKFLQALIEKTRKLKIGPALSYDTDFGPVISRDLRDRLLKFIRTGQEEGASVACGGKIPSGEGLNGGFYIEPTILANVTNDMTVAREEAFGPVLSVIKFRTEEEAVRLANDSPYGLAASVWTKDLDKAQSVSKQLRCGVVWINTYGGFYNEASFGGYKQSGFGRELGAEGLWEYTQSKHICIDTTPGGRPLVSSWF